MCELALKESGKLDMNQGHLRDHFFFPVALRPKAGHGLLILEVSRSHTHNDASQSVGLLWTSDHCVAETSDYTQHLIQTSTSPVGFEPTISAGERP